MKNPNEKHYPDKGLPIGTKVPQKDFTDIYGEKIQFEDILTTSRGILIDFFRGAFWVPCKEHLDRINNHISEFKEKKVKFIAISTDSVNHSRELVEEHDYQFTVISDRGAKIAKDFNVYIFGRAIDIVYLKTKLAVPSTFLINKNLEIIWTYIGDREDRPSVDLLMTQIKEKLT